MLATFSGASPLGTIAPFCHPIDTSESRLGPISGPATGQSCVAQGKQSQGEGAKKIPLRSLP